MLQRLVVCAALACALLATKGFAQTPSQCVATHRIELDRMDLYITPGVINCFTCALDATGDVNWQVTLDGDLVVVTLSPDAVADGNFLIIAMPDNYVQPGTSGRQNIVCSRAGNEALRLEARLSSPILRLPLFPDVTVNEDATLKVTCVGRNIPDITMLEILNPNNMPVPTSLGVYTRGNVTRNFAGTYTCVVRSTLDNSTVSETATVIIQYVPEVTAINDTAVSHRIILGEELRFGCSYVGVPNPTVVWLRNDVMLMDGVDGVTIIGGGPSDNEITLVISSVVRESNGTYTCRANNTIGMDIIGMDQQLYSVTILVPADPVTNLSVTGVTETSVSLSWMTGGDGFTPITGIEILVTPERGDPPTMNPIRLEPSNMTIINNLRPFRDHEFSVAVVNLAGTSDRVNITAGTLSESLGMPMNPMLEAVNSTSLRLTWEPPIFNADTTDDPDFYLVDFSLLNTSNHVASNISATLPLMVNFNQLLKGTLYIARVVPVNEVGNGTGTNFLETQTNVDPPSEPLNLIVSGVGAAVLFVNWTAPADNGGRAVSDYRVFIDGISFNRTIMDPTITSLLIRDQGLTENTTYIVRVSAANREQGFGNAATAVGTTQSILEPQTIFDVPQPVSSTNGSAVLSWENPGGTVDAYIVQYVLSRDTDGFQSPDVVTVTVNAPDTMVTVENLLPGASYDFRVAVNNSRGISAFSMQGRFETLEPDPAVITVSRENPVPQGITITLNCTAPLRGSIMYSWMKDNAELPGDIIFDVNPTLGYLRITMVTPNSEGSYVCRARNEDGTETMSAAYTIEVLPTEAPTSGGIDQNVIIIVAAVGGGALLIFVIVVIIAICCLCSMKAKSTKSSYAMKPMKSKDRPNANWIETSTQFVPATGNQAAEATGGDRLAFDYSVDLQTHSSFNTLEKQKVHSTANGSDQPPPPSYSDNATDV